MEFTAANILTFSRLVIAPVFVVCFIMGLKGWALGLFCFGGFTDLIDGSVARILNQPSKDGALLDPLADKILLESCFITLFVAGYLPWWFVILAIFRDLMIVSGIMYLKHKKIELPYGAVLSSKLATLMQLCVAILGLILWYMSKFSPSYDAVAWWQLIAVYVASALIIISGSQYMLLGFKIIHKLKK